MSAERSAAATDICRKNVLDAGQLPLRFDVVTGGRWERRAARLCAGERERAGRSRRVARVGTGDGRPGIRLPRLLA